VDSTSVRNEIQEALKEFLGEDDFHRDTSLMDAGVDSLIAVDIRKRLADTFNLALPATLVFDYPSLGDMEAYITASSGTPPTRGPQRSETRADRPRCRVVSCGASTKLAPNVDSTSIRNEIQDALTEFLGADDIHRDSSLMDAGVDSLIAVDIRKRLANTFSLALPATLVFDYPSLGDMEAFIMASSGTPPIREPQNRRAPAERPRRRLVGRSAPANQAPNVQSTSVCNEIREALVEFLGGDDIHEDTSLLDAGVDSLIAVDIRKRITETFSLPLPATLVFDYPSLGDMKAYITS
jgi:acyl carrier protein